MVSIVESEFGLLDTDTLSGEELLELYTAATATITNVTPHQQEIHTFTAIQGLTM